MTLTDTELGIVTDSAYDSLNDVSEHDIMHAYYIYLDYFNEYVPHYDYWINYHLVYHWYAWAIHICPCVST